LLVINPSQQIPTKAMTTRKRKRKKRAMDMFGKLYQTKQLAKQQKSWQIRKL
jgi:hypothetical protein